MMNKNIFCLVFVLLSCSLLLRAQVRINISPNVFLTFPNNPDILDTLGQKVYHYTDETGYYACIVQQTTLNPTKRSALDVNRFYNEVYQTVQMPEDHCNLVRQKNVTIEDLSGIEFYATCDPHPDRPELRFKRLLLYETKLFVMDFWTTQAYYSQADANKSGFFESMSLELKGDPSIPSALEPSETSDNISYNWLILLLVLIPVVYLFVLRKPKK